MLVIKARFGAMASKRGKNAKETERIADENKCKRYLGEFFASQNHLIEEQTNLLIRRVRDFFYLSVSRVSRQ